MEIRRELDAVTWNYQLYHYLNRCLLSLWTTSKAYDYKHKVDSPQDAEPNQRPNPK